MEGSGLDDAFKLIYASNCVVKMFSGHALSRAIRAHLFVYLSVGKMIFDLIDFSDKEADAMEAYLSGETADQLEWVAENLDVENIRNKFDRELGEKSHSKTVGEIF